MGLSYKSLLSSFMYCGVDSNVCTIGGNSIRETGHNLSKGSPHWGTADFKKDIRVKFNFGSINET